MATQKPTINLVSFRNIVVNTQTQEEHTTLLRVYESAGWTWLMGDLPTSINHFPKFRELTYLQAENGFLYGSIEDSWIKDCSRTVIIPEEFYKLQKVTLEDVMSIDPTFKHFEQQKREWAAEKHP